MNQVGRSESRGALDRLQLQGRHWNYSIAGGDEFNDAYLESVPSSGNTILKVKRKRYWYREHHNRLADLILFKQSLPDVVCIGFDRDRLSQIIEHEFDRFYLKSDPIVRRIRNARRLGVPAVIITLVPTWSEANWDYSDGADAHFVA